MLADYDLVKRLGSTTHLAVCRKGRLRCRKVVLKEASHQLESATIHQRLHHPSIVSLLTVFQTPSTCYYALEYCDEGPLATLLPIAESELLRDITRSISSALEYLRKELVLHRSITTKSIFLACGKHAKLSDFDTAVQIPTALSSMTSACGSSDFASPEMKNGCPYSFATDVWSLGCVLASCISGTSSLKTVEGTPGVDENLLDLLRAMLHMSPSARIQVHEILSHPFLVEVATSTPNGRLSQAKLDAPIPQRHKKPSIAALSNSISTTRRPFMHTSATRVVSETVVNDELRKLLTDELVSVSKAKGPPRRVVSEPISRPPNRPSSPIKRGTVISSSKPISRLEDKPNHLNRPQDEGALNWIPQSTNKPLPVGLTRPLPLETLLLPPQSHKTIHGRLTILPNRSLLVDFRESQRKLGLKESEVMVISPSGLQIDVHHATRSSHAPIRDQPLRSYQLTDLPSSYWQQYNDASRLIEEIKRRTPQLILYTPTARCTLWANGPPADIELLFRSYLPSHASVIDSAPTMRIRFSRKHRSMEIMRYVHSGAGGEWIKKDYLGIKHPNDIGYSERKLLHADELDGLDQTTVFLLQCETIEAVSQVASPSHSGLPTNTSATPTLRNSLSSATPSLIRSLNTTLVPPPTKPVLDPTPDVEIDLRPSSVQTIETKLDTSLLSLDIDPMSGLSEPSVDAQTRFIPSVGWCIRCESRVSQGGRFKIMFLDGATLDINVDEDWAEFMDPSGIVTRHGIRDCNTRRKISDRFRQFEAFLSLYEN